MGSSSSPSPPPPPMIGRAGNLTVFITPPSPASTPRAASRTPPPESPRSDLSTPASQRAAASPSPSPSPRKASSPAAAPAVVFTPPPPPGPVKVAPPPVQVPPPQYEKVSAGGKHDGSAFGFFWDAVARVQEAHASLDEYVANWFGLDQSKYQWALNDYYEATGKVLFGPEKGFTNGEYMQRCLRGGACSAAKVNPHPAISVKVEPKIGLKHKEVDCVKGGMTKELTTAKVQKV